MTRERRKLIVIGLDGATFDYIVPMCNQGKLPNFKFLLDSGAYAALESVFTPFTAMAWSSLLSGMNPGKTGIFDALRRKPGTYDLEATHLRGMRVPALWDYLNMGGLKTCVINVPMTYPARPIDGWLITGFDTPPGAKRNCFPPSFLEDLEHLGRPYQLFQLQGALTDALHRSGPIAEYVQMAVECVTYQKELIGFLLDYPEWDFFMTVCQCTDFINHKTSNWEALTEIYQEADNLIGSVISWIQRSGEPVMLMVVSDHGSRPFQKFVNLNVILEKAGLLRFNPVISREAIERLVRRLRIRGLFVNILIDSWKKLPLPLQTLISWPLLRIKPELRYGYSNIDWRHTKVYTLGHMGAIYINLEGREPSGVVSESDYELLRSEVIELLHQVRDPDTGEHVFKEICRTEEMWSGPYMSEAPDLVFTLNSPFDSGGSRGRMIYPDDYPGGRGVHDERGIFIAWGYEIEPGNKGKFPITHVAPTILAYLNQPIPVEMDGEVELQIFRPELSTAVPIQKYQAKEMLLEDRWMDQIDEEGEEAILERLRGLGYIE